MPVFGIGMHDPEVCCNTTATQAAHATAITTATAAGTTAAGTATAALAPFTQTSWIGLKPADHHSLSCAYLERVCPVCCFILAWRGVAWVRRYLITLWLRRLQPQSLAVKDTRAPEAMRAAVAPSADAGPRDRVAVSGGRCAEAAGQAAALSR